MMVITWFCTVVVWEVERLMKAHLFRRHFVHQSFVHSSEKKKKTFFLIKLKSFLVCIHISFASIRNKMSLFYSINVEFQSYVKVW